MEPGSDSSANLREPSGEAGGNWSSPWGPRHCQLPFGGAHSTLRTQALAGAITEMSLELLSTRTRPQTPICQNQSWDPPGQAASHAKIQPLLATGCSSCGPPEPFCPLWTQSHTPKGPEFAPLTSRMAEAPVTPRAQQLTIA